MSSDNLYLFTVRAHLEITHAQEIWEFLSSGQKEVQSFQSYNADCHYWYCCINNIINTLHKEGVFYQVAIHKDSTSLLSDMEKGWGCIHIIFQDRFCPWLHRWDLMYSCGLTYLCSLSKETAYMFERMEDNGEFYVMETGSTVAMGNY